MLSLDIGVHYLAKKLLNRFALSKKSNTSLLSTSNGGISGTLLPFTKWQDFQDGPICFGSCFRVIKFISKAFLLFQFGRTYIAFDVSSVIAFKDV